MKVLMLNINPGNNVAIFKKCRRLWEYCEFVACIRRHAQTEKINIAVEKAVEECISKEILSDFLLSQKAEVVAMSIFEYNEEEEMKKMRAAEFNYGKEAGVKLGIETGREEGCQALRDSIFSLLSGLGEVPETIRKRISQEKDMELLQEWLRVAATAKSIESFLECLEKAP